MEVRRVVVIEDESVLRLQASEMFEAAGFAVVGFENGDVALDYLRENRDGIFAVFTDVKLYGETDGVELARLVAEACPDIAVVMASGQLAERPPGLNERVRYLAKPWQPMDVLNAIVDAKIDDQ